MADPAADATADQVTVIDAGEHRELLEGLVTAGETLPFNRHMGVVVRELGIGRCVTALPQHPGLANHLGAVHAIAELAPAELAAALAGSSRLVELVVRGYVPVVGSLRTRFRAPAHGELLATAEVGEEAIGPAIAAADAGERPRVTVEVTVTDATGTVVQIAEVDLVYLEMAAH